MSTESSDIIWDGDGWSMRVIDPTKDGLRLAVRYLDDTGQQLDISCDERWSVEANQFTSFMLYRDYCYDDFCCYAPSHYSRQETDAIIEKITAKLKELGIDVYTSPY